MKKLPVKHESLIETVHFYGLNIRDRTIYVNSESYLDCGGESGTDFQMCTSLIKNLDLLNACGRGKQAIKIKAANVGGDWWYGMGMFDAIRKSRCPVDYYIHAHACSMGSIIPQAARKRYIDKNADFLIHLGSYFQSDVHFKTAKAHMDFYDIKNPVMYDIYAERCQHGKFFKDKKMTKDETKDFIVDKIDKVQEWWLTSEESVLYGFADEVI